MARLTKLNRVFNRIELNYTNLTIQIKDWLSSVYEKSDVLFNSASPYGQILDVVKELFLQNILYLKNFVKQLDIDQANSKRMISNIARISGHNPSRAISAKGTLQFKLKQGTDINAKVSGGQVIIYDNTILKNKSNGYYYTLKVGVDKNYYTLLPGCQFFINVVQGKYESQTFTGTGNITQSFQVSVSNNSVIDNFDFKVTLNGINLQIKDHLYDMLANEYACYTRTGFNGGLDIYFGNGIFGIVPPIGSVIKVEYLLTNGLAGNILNNQINDFTFIDDVYDGSGDSVRASDLFDIFVNTDIKFASNGESLEYTKSVIPYVSRNFVLATPQQYTYHLKKLNMFSKVNAFNNLDMVKIDIDGDGTVDDKININEIYLYLIPRITDYFSSDVNYFNVPLSAFDLDDDEKKRIIKYLKMQGIISITSKITIINPKKIFFVINVFIRKYDDVEEENIREDVITLLSDFFANYSRYDRVVKSDLISQLKEIDGIDSVNIEFVSKQNEDYYRDGAVLSTKSLPVIETTYATTGSDFVNLALDGRNTKDLISVGNTTSVAYRTTKPYDKKRMINIDSTLGDIIIGKNELVILRGGWRNRNGVYFSDDPKTTTGFSSVNIIWKGTTPRK